MHFFLLLRGNGHITSALREREGSISNQRKGGSVDWVLTRGEGVHNPKLEYVKCKYMAP